MLSFFAACGGSDSDGDFVVVVQWRTDLGALAAPPGLGAQNTLVVATSVPPGRIRGIDQLTAINVHGPFDTVPAQRAPVAIGAELFFVNSAGGIVHLNLAGQILPAPGVRLGVASPMVLGGDNILRLGSTSGRLFGFRTDGSTAYDEEIVGAVDTAPAVDSQGRAYYALDGGAVTGVDQTGEEIFRQPVLGPASGPSVRGSRLAVGGGDGVYVFDTNLQTEVFRRNRAARVVGTRWLESGELLAWGEDGIVELLAADGSPLFGFNAGPPIYTPVVPVPGDAFGVIDSNGMAYRINRNAVVESEVFLGGIPSREVAVTEQGWVAVAIGTEILAVNFALSR